MVRLRLPERGGAGLRHQDLSSRTHGSEAGWALDPKGSLYVVMYSTWGVAFYIGTMQGHQVKAFPRGLPSKGFERGVSTSGGKVHPTVQLSSKL